jgi:hypothetical protein
MLYSHMICSTHAKGEEWQYGFTDIAGYYNWHCMLLSVMDDRQLVTGYSGLLFRGHRRMKNSMVNSETTIYTGSVRRNSVGVPTSSLRWIVYYALRLGFRRLLSELRWGLFLLFCQYREPYPPLYSPGDKSYSRLQCINSSRIIK